MENEIINKLLIDKEISIKGAMKIIDEGGWGIGFVVENENKLFGVVTDGDIRRAILRGLDFEKPIKMITSKNPIFIKGRFTDKDFLELRAREDIKEKIPVGGSLKVPLVNDEGEIQDLIFIYGQGRDNFQIIKSKPKNGNEGIKRILLIGGAGYLGSVLSRKLLSEGYKVRVLDNLTYGDWGIRELYGNNDFEFLKGDIRNISDIVGAIKRIDAVIHLAAIVGDPACVKDPEETLETNYLATKNITEACKYFQINRFIFASTCSVYGENLSPDQKLTEESQLAPVSLYAETKIKCERSILEAMDENFSPTILRMATLYGYSPNMRFDLVVNLLTAKAIFDKKIPIFGGDQWRPWLGLDDAAQAYLECLRVPVKKVRGEIFNALSENYKIIEVGRKINSFCPWARLEINKKATDKRDYNVSFAKITKLLNFQPKKKIIDGVADIKKAIEAGVILNYQDPKYRVSLPQF